MRRSIVAWCVAAAFGLRRTKDPITEWPLLVERWLRAIRMIPE